MPNVLVVGRPDAPDPSDLLPLLRTLTGRRHRVLLLATENHRRTAEESGAEFRLLPSLPPVTDRDPRWLVAHARRLFRRLFIDSMQTHWPVVHRVLSEDRPDVVLADALCFAACAIAELPRPVRPPVVVLGTIPPPHANPASAPYGLGIVPSEALVNRLRNRLLHHVTRHILLGPVLPELRTLFRQLTGYEMGQDTYDAATTAEVWAQCEPERFEYPPRNDPTLRLVGPLTPAGPSGLPHWWQPDDEQQIIAIRGSDHTSLHDLVVPAILALTGRPGRRIVVTGVDHLSVVTALGRDLPPDVQVAEDLPTARLLPGTHAVVMRGWFVHALHALQQGVPVIAIGTGAEEVETAARLRWHGCGLGIRSDSPTAQAIREAVDRVTTDPLHARAAARIAAQSADMRAEQTIADIADRLMHQTDTAPPDDGLVET